MTEAVLDRARSEEPTHDAIAVPHSATLPVKRPFRACVHRGTRQVGGTCAGLECAGARLLLDLGLPLDADAAGDPVRLLPDVSGLLALIVSHGHADHWGLAPSACPSLPVVVGAATRRILLAAAPFVPRPAPSTQC